MLNAKTKEIVKNTAPVLKENSHQIGKRFYELLFLSAPELMNIFNQTNQKKGIQQEALGYVVYAAGEHINNLEVLTPVIRRINEKHRAIGIRADQYPIVGETLLQAVRDVLEDAATPEILDAWGQAYGYIANLFIQMEKELYEETEKQAGGWSGYRRFIVDKKEEETKEITSFYLKPEDGKAITSYKAGQYLTLKADIPEEPYTHIRHYSLSEAPGKDYYRISVKREDAASNDPEGIVSHYLHDHIQKGDKLLFSAPAGDFVLSTDEFPVVLISGGIGITPLLSMLNDIVERQPQREVRFIHATKNGQTHAFKTHLTEIVQSNKNVNCFVCYTSPTQEDKVSHQFDKEGYIDLNVLSSIKPVEPAQYYLCGSPPFMEDIIKKLSKLNVPKENIHFESFSPIAMLDEE
ncbi:NO-inducible flavohemoprotein [Paenibacillus xylanilyticus]|uniref:Flavohemoprotein n=1 Tax=Paenibacillus xylanilyticus TaxID=248903 RepID=A0A7Y6C213_9BACL|nr:NO-inducible flavohemoprotein [Paenibacillus xylanilyticus]NUU79168.1 NO-inducible flavohemoprotein [Paenibacillus xylanilyticus]